MARDTLTETESYFKLAEDVSTAGVGKLYAGYIKTDGSLWCTKIQPQATPNKLADKAVNVKCFGYTLAAVDSNGTLCSWDMSKVPNYEPLTIADDVVAVSIGSRGAGAFIKKDGTLWAFGYDVRKTGEWVDYTQPHELGGGFSEISVQDYHEHSLARKTDGSVISWYLEYSETDDEDSLSNANPIEFK